MRMIDDEGHYRGQISQREARKRGLKRFFTGEPCVRGHVMQRFTVNGCCVKCSREDSMRSRKQLPPIPKPTDYFADKGALYTPNQQMKTLNQVFR